jgi:hypothetical protein
MSKGIGSFKTEYELSSSPYDITALKNKRKFIAFYFGSAHKKFRLDSKRDQENKDLIKKISIWSGMSYSDLRSAHREKNGSEFIPVSSLNKPLPYKYFSSEIKKVDVMRFSGSSCRLIGVYSESDSVFDVAFVDYSLEIYKH